MKKRNVLNLIKYHSEKNDFAFRQEAYEIANEFDRTGDSALAEYIMALLSDVSTFVPQEINNNLSFVRHSDVSSDPLPLPEVIVDDISGIINAISYDCGINKYLFYGDPGTGKTETVKQLARILNRELFIVDTELIVDSKLGQTAKNIRVLFDEINRMSHPESTIILFDELDSLALDRINSNDLREMGRATSTLLKGLDSLNQKTVIIATTNLYHRFDSALVRRFDKVVDFSRYTRDDLISVADNVLEFYLSIFRHAGRSTKLFHKILNKTEALPYPAELKNIIKTSISFSNPDNPYDYFRRLFLSINKKNSLDIQELKHQGYTLREMEILTASPRSTISRKLQEVSLS